MLATAFLVALALLPAAAASEGGPQVFDLGIKDSEPHLRHRFIDVHGRPTEIRTRLADLAAAGFTAEQTARGVVLRRGEREWVGDQETLLVAQWFHTRLYIANQRELIAADPRYEVVHTYYPNYPSTEGEVRMAATVRDLAKSGLRPDFLDTGEPVLVDRSGKTLRGDEWAMAVSKAWQEGKGADAKRRAGALGKAGEAASSLGGGPASRNAAPAARSGSDGPEAVPAAPGTAMGGEPSGSSAPAGDGPPRRPPPPRALSAEIFGLAPSGDGTRDGHVGGGEDPDLTGGAPGSSAARSIRDVPVPEFGSAVTSSDAGTMERGPAPQGETSSWVLDTVGAWFSPQNPRRGVSILLVVAVIALVLYSRRRSP